MTAPDCLPDYFPVPEGHTGPDKRGPLARVLVMRKEGSGSGSTWVTAPHSFSQEELPNLEAVYQRFGGGHYMLKGFGPAGTAIATNNSIVFSGPSLPLAPSATSSDAAPLTAAVPVASAPPPGSSLLQDVLAVVTVVTPIAAAWLQSSEARSRAEAEARRAEAAAAREASERSNREHRELMLAMMAAQSRAQERAVDLFAQQARSADPAAAAAAAAEALKKGVEMGKDLGAAGDDGKLVEMVIGAFGAYQASKAQAQAAAQAAAPRAPLPPPRAAPPAPAPAPAPPVPPPPSPPSGGAP